MSDEDQGDVPNHEEWSKRKGDRKAQKKQDKRDDTSTDDITIAYVLNAHRWLRDEYPNANMRGDVRFDAQVGVWRVYRQGWWDTLNDDQVLGMLGTLRKAMADGEAQLLPTETDEQGRVMPVQGKVAKWLRGKLIDGPAWGTWLMRSLKLETAKMLEGVEWDSVPNVLVMANVTLEMRLDERRIVARPHSPEDYSTRRTTVLWNPMSVRERRPGWPKSKVWGQFLRQIARGEDRTHSTRWVWSLLEELSGTLTTNGWGEVWLELLGGGANGKSRLVDAVCSALGDYAIVADRSTFTAPRFAGDGSGPSTQIAMLEGRRLVVVPEVQARQKLNSASVKSWVSKDKITARHLHERHRVFKPAGLLVMTTNLATTFDDGGQAMISRIRSFEFKSRWARSPEEAAETGLPLADEQLGHKLESEIEQQAIIYTLARAWAVRARRGKAITISETKVQKDDDRMLSGDVVEQFSQECLMHGKAADDYWDKIASLPKKPGKEGQLEYVSSEDLHWAFRAWAKERSVGYIPSLADFMLRLARPGSGLKKLPRKNVTISPGVVIKRSAWSGVAITDEWQSKAAGLKAEMTRDAAGATDY